jgi:flagellar assembly protein FliH
MATIIKASDSTCPNSGSSFRLEDLTFQADSTVNGTQIHAAAIVVNSHKEATAIRRRPDDEGRQEVIRAAEKLAEEQLDKKLATLLPAVKQFVDQLAHAKDAWRAHWEKAAIHVATRIAERVIRRQIAEDPQITASLVSEALELAAGSPEIQVRMHPEDLAVLGSHVEALTRELASQSKAKVIPDGAVSRGGCRVETRFGTIDHRIEEQLNRIEEELTAS